MRFKCNILSIPILYQYAMLYKTFKGQNMQDQIDFYGASQRELFAIERESMDRQGKVIARLNQVLPQGTLLDIGAGDGYTAKRIQNRTIVCLEPASGMVNFDNTALWVKGTAEAMPFHNHSFDAAYATWAYFLPGQDKTKGLQEAERVVKPGGRLVIVDNAGEDTFCSLAADPIFEGPDFYLQNGFTQEIIETAFEFKTHDEAYRLMSLYFGEAIQRETVQLEYDYRVALYIKDL